MKGEGNPTSQNRGTKCTITAEQIAVQSPTLVRLFFCRAPAENLYTDQKSIVDVLTRTAVSKTDIVHYDV